MSDIFKNSYFALLPNEVLIQILKDVDTLTLMNFCDIYECDYFFEDREVTKNIKLAKAYQLPDFTILSKKIIPEHVTTVNINCIYWPTATTLRKFVSKLVKLKTLYAIKTNLSLTSGDREAYNKTIIEKLGVTIKKNDEMGLEKMPTIKTLYINFVTPPASTTPLTLDTHFPELKKLWIDLEEPSTGRPILSALSPGHRNKIYCRINAPVPAINFEWSGLERYYNNRRSYQYYEMCCERLSASELSSRNSTKTVTGPWQVIEELHCSVPYGPRDARQLHLKEATLESIFFEELNFSHTGVNCAKRYVEAQKQILKSPTARGLKRLCIMTCLFENKETTNSDARESPTGFKRKRISLVNSTTPPDVDIFENIPDLEHLELFYESKNSHISIVQGFPLIAKFKKLKSLFIEVPVIVDGSFIAEVFEHCKFLEYLKINSVAQNEKLNIHMCNALPKASSLKDLSYQNHRMPLDKLFESLCKLKSTKLERILLICKETDIFSAGPLKAFLESNSQVVFLYIVVRNATDVALKMAQKTLNSYKKLHPSKVFLAKTVHNSEVGYPIPAVHFCEMMKSESKVATLRALDQYESF